MESLSQSQADEAFAEGLKVFPGGVSAAARMNHCLGRPFYVSGGAGGYLFDLDGTRYVDFNMSNGAAFLGHGHPKVEQALVEGLRAGIVAGTETRYHAQLAETLIEIIPCAEKVRFASTGTEATMHALRLARAATGRDVIVKFEGHYHGLHELVLFKAPDPAEPDGSSIPSSAGVPAAWGREVIVLPFNDTELVDAVLTARAGEIAAVILEPVHFNAGCIEPALGFLDMLRNRTRDLGIVLIFDEVLSGFRMALGGVQEYSGVTPDLCTLAKAVANGMPLSVIAGRADLMDGFAPAGPVAHSGTYSGHLLSVLAGIATLEVLREPGLYDDLLETSEVFYRDLQEVFDRHDLPVVVQGLGARFGLYFGRRERVQNYRDALGHDHDLNRRFVVGCIERGIYFHAYTGKGAPGHAGFSLAHTRDDFALTLDVADTVCREIAAGAR
jgi:glutamate-1-semialdehyde 2,1-aminomutase